VRTALLAAFALLAPFVALSSGQEAAEDAVFTASSASVEIRPEVSDQSIERRLRAIAGVIEGYEDVRIAVEHGVVRLSGQVPDDEARVWLRDLAERTEGIVAVSNALTVAKRPFWDLDPALSSLQSSWESFLAATPRLLAGLGVLVLVFFLAPLTTRLVAGPLRKRVKGELLKTVVTKTAGLAFWVFGLYVFLRVSGLTQAALTVVGGTGVLGIVLGFAFRDIAENFLASVLISLQRPFRYGDTIEVEGHLGVVQRVTPRGTILMDFDGNFIQIANATVYKSTIKNFTANPSVRLSFDIGIGYDAQAEHAQGIVLDVLREHPVVLPDPVPMVLVTELASATVNLRAFYWIDGTRFSQHKARSAIMRKALVALQDAGISMPDDAREVIFPEGVKVLEEGDSGAGNSSPAQAASSTPREDVTDAEDGLESETVEIQEQIRGARQPEEGADVLANHG
jgi:small conductance mechanosensitive channel